MSCNHATRIAKLESIVLAVASGSWMRGDDRRCVYCGFRDDLGPCEHDQEGCIVLRARSVLGIE